MFAPAKELAAADADVVALLGADAERFYSFGEAPPNVDPVAGYATWQVVGGAPDNYLAGRPTEDEHVVQVDAYAKFADKAKRITRALVRAFELRGYVTAWNGEFIDPDTKLRRISFTVEFITPR